MLKQQLYGESLDMILPTTNDTSHQEWYFPLSMEKIFATPPSMKKGGPRWKKLELQKYNHSVASVKMKSIL